MATRAERVDEALGIVEGAEDLLWALALNRGALRRSYFLDVTGLANGVVLKRLAKLANAGMLDATDGLKFKLVTPEIAREVATRIPEGDARRIHAESLAFAEQHGEPLELFRIHHLLGLERFEDVARELLELRQARDDLNPLAVAGFVRRTHAGLEAEDEADADLLEELGVWLLEAGRGAMKPREARILLNRMLAGELKPESRARLEAVDQALKKAKAEAKAEAKAAQAAERAAPAQVAAADAAAATPSSAAGGGES